jgi:hypothetical protein
MRALSSNFRGDLQSEPPAHDDSEPLARIAGEIRAGQPVLKPSEPSVKIGYRRHGRIHGLGSFGGGTATVKSL